MHTSKHGVHVPDGQGASCRCLAACGRCCHCVWFCCKVECCCRCAESCHECCGRPDAASGVDLPGVQMHLQVPVHTPNTRADQQHGDHARVHVDVQPQHSPRQRQPPQPVPAATTAVQPPGHGKLRQGARANNWRPSGDNVHLPRPMRCTSNV